MKKLWQTDQALDAAVEAYTVGDDPIHDAKLLPYEVYGSLGHAEGLRRAGLLSAADLKAARRELRLLLAEADRFVIRREQEDIHTAVEQHLTERIGDVGARIHTGRSRNDQVQVDLRLFLKDRLLDLHRLTCDAAAAWSEFGRAHSAQPLPGYTHLQRAMPTTLGHWAAAHVEGLLDGTRSLRHALEDADACPLGSAAGYGTPLPLDRMFVSKRLGFARLQRNTLRVQTSRPRIEASTLAALALLARDLGVLAWDLSLYTTAEFGFLELADAFTTGSSIMPQKKNPDVVELTRARAAFFPGWLQQVMMLGALPSGYHRDYQLGKGPLFQALTAARQMLEIVARIPGSLKVNADRCRAAVTEDMLATHRALALVRGGLPFREAYRRIAAQARKSRRSRPACSYDLPAYAGSPGNPDWPAIAADLSLESRWGRRVQGRLHRAWRSLLEG